jgi:hypothetical protein
MYVQVTYKISYLWTYNLCGPVRNAFDAGNSITRASGMGLDPKNRDFLGPVKWHRTISASAIWCPKKARLKIRLEINMKR